MEEKHQHASETMTAATHTLAAPIVATPSSTAGAVKKAQTRSAPRKACDQVALLLPGTRVRVRGIAKKSFTIKRADDPKGLTYLLEEVAGVYSSRNVTPFVLLPPNEQCSKEEVETIPASLASLAPDPPPESRLGPSGFVLLAEDATPLLPMLQQYVGKLVFEEMSIMPDTQSDKLRRVHAVSKSNSLHAQLVEYGERVMGRVLGEVERCPVYKPVILATAPGAAPQRAHADHPHKNAYSLLIAIQPRELGIVGRPIPVSLSSPGDTIVFDAALCHYGMGHAADADGVVFAVHLFAGAGVNTTELGYSFGC
jgi:hypothetical protein